MSTSFWAVAVLAALVVWFVWPIADPMERRIIVGAAAWALAVVGTIDIWRTKGDL